MHLQDETRERKSRVKQMLRPMNSGPSGKSRLKAILAIATLLTAAVCCRAADLLPGLHDRTIVVNGRERSYILSIPEKATEPAPVLFFLHGGGGTAEEMTRMGVQQEAGPLGFVTAFPQGYGNSWNAGPGPDNRSPNYGLAFRDQIDDVAFFKALIADIARVVKIDRRRLYSAGWSNGSAMSFRLAMELSDTFAAVAGCASELSLYDPPPPKRPVPMMYFWGTLDPIQRPGAPDAAERSRRHLQNWFRLNRVSSKGTLVKKVRKAECTLYPPLAGGADAIVWKIEGMGHEWPGLVPRNPIIRERTETALGPYNTDISANREMIDFFLKHSLP